MGLQPVGRFVTFPLLCKQMSNEAITAQALHIKGAAKATMGKGKNNAPWGTPGCTPMSPLQRGRAGSVTPLPCLGKPKHPFSCHPKFMLATSSEAAGQKEDHGLRFQQLWG